MPYSYPKGAPKVFAPFDRSRRPVSLANIRASQVTALPQSHVRCLIVSRLALGITQDENIVRSCGGIAAREHGRVRSSYSCASSKSLVPAPSMTRATNGARTQPPRKPGLKGENDRTVRPISGSTVNLALNADYPRL